MKSAHRSLWLLMTKIRIFFLFSVLHFCLFMIHQLLGSHNNRMILLVLYILWAKEVSTKPVVPYKADPRYCKFGINLSFEMDFCRDTLRMLEAQGMSINW